MTRGCGRMPALSACIVLLFIAGCRTLGPSYRPVTKIPDGKAVVYIYRPWRLGGALDHYVVHAGDEPIVRIYNGGYHVYLASPGETEFWTQWFRGVSTTEYLKAGSVYYLRASVYPSLGYSATLQWVSEEQGMEEIARCNEIPFN